MGDLKALAHIRCSINVGWICKDLEGKEFCPRNRQWGNSHEKAFDGSGGGAFISCPPQALPTPLHGAASRQEIVLFVFAFVMFHTEPGT